jgi:hypothetical protein
MATSILHLIVLRNYFNQIAQGVKKEEFRGRTGYWATLLESRRYDIVRFRNGYAKNAPTIDVEFLGVRRERDCYVIRLGRVFACHR